LTAAFNAVFYSMKTIQPVYEIIKETLYTDTLYVKVGKRTAQVQRVYKNPKGIFIYSSLGEHKVDLFTELYIE
jgi:hypothetical protein